MICRKLRSIGWGAALLPALCLLTGFAPAAALSPGSLASHTMPAADVLIDAGHGGIDSGTHWGDVMEKDINLAISRKLYLILRSRGVKAVLNRTGDYALSDENRWHRASRHSRDLSQRGGLSEEIEPRMFVSIHVNWAPKRRKRGPLVLHQPEGRSALLASFIQEGLNRQQKTSRHPIAESSFYVLNRIRVPSVIVETAFLSDPGDRAMLTSTRGQTRIAAAIAEGIIAYRCISP
ncbi:N-acetylmuramoyl-L-alanine amidase [Cohnella lubricantis]|uniref:N-acetylmuramoyl-L-alanine amidase n=1 Tax=Cohnella lubricantis TaxID=2163172 RepID=A0A841TEJ8_9BACL|nr:N-acetylmuramoyl-L-alanine amidase [Cohnella lubricantis]MBB6676881.1 N-acetylmuramoyl-L-alanine amidase [Cohnella lubricantis]MBP2118281.1 N-acetylmuramoyl-L-alanine amidase [Cohnella lubricantis]